MEPAGEASIDALGLEDPEMAEEIVRSATPPPARAEPDAADPSPPRHPVRERLLARAAAARQERTPSSPGGLDALLEAPSEPKRPLDLELDLVGAGAARPPAAPVLGKVHAQLSPNLLAVFGTLLGLTTVASVIALAIHLQPIEHPEARTAQARAPSPTITAPKPSATPAEPKIVGPWRIADESDNPHFRIIKGQVGVSPFLKAVQDAGLSKKQAYRVFDVLKELKNLDKCGRTDRFMALVARGSKELKAFEYIVSKEEIYQAREDADHRLVAKKLDLKVEHTQLKGAIAYDGGDLDAAAGRAGFPPGLADVIDTALDGHLDVDDLKRGDVLRVIVQEVRVLGAFSRYAGVEALEYRPADAKSKPLRVYYFRDTQGGAYYDASGHANYNGGWRKPIEGAPITSPYSLHRMHPILHRIMPHLGIDFGARTGTPVGASSYGVIEFMGAAGAAGNMVKIKHPGGIETGYMHLSRFAQGLHVGDHVKRMQVIGYVGATGRATGPHLHFMAKKNGKYIDPETLHLDAMRVLPQDERAAFDKVKASYDQILDSIALPAALPSTAPGKGTAGATPPPEQSGVAQAPAPAKAPKGDLARAPRPTVPANASAATAPTGPAPAQTAATAPAPQKKPSAVYMTDQELLKMQSAEDDGEVSH